MSTTNSGPTMAFFFGGGITAFIIVVMVGTQVAPHARIPNVVWLLVFIGGGVVGLFIEAWARKQNWIK
jgi:hypothetical protein